MGIYDLVGAAQIMGPKFMGIGCIAAGFVAGVFAFLGFCGAMKQSPCALSCVRSRVLSCVALTCVEEEEEWWWWWWW